MKSLFKFIAIATGVLLLSVVLTPILFKFLPFKFEKIFNRVVMILTLAAGAFFVRLNLKKVAAYGLEKNPNGAKQIAIGFTAGLITLLLLTFLKINFGLAYWNLSQLSLSRWVYKVVVIFFTAFLIGTIEEFFFRGVVFRSLTDCFRGNSDLAVILTSLFYSVVHFISIKKPYIGSDPGVKDSLKLLIAPFLSLTQWPDFWRGAIGLFIFGVVLNRLAIRTKSLMMSIGLHAGCVFFVKIDGLFVEFLNQHPILWGSAKMYDGLTGWVFLALMGVTMMSLLTQTGFRKKIMSNGNS